MVYIAIIMLLGIVLVSRLASYIAIMHKYIATYRTNDCKGHVAIIYSPIYACKRRVFAMCSYVGS